MDGLIPRGRIVVLGGVALVFTSVLSRCNPASPPTRVGPVPEVLPPPVSSEPVDASLARAVPDAATDAPSADATPSSAAVASDAKVFHCGNITCRSGQETCCLASNEGICLPSSPNDAPAGKVGYLKTQFEACNQAKLPHGYSLSGIERCDESIDCGNGELCCDEFLFSGATMGECVAGKATGPTPCDFGERCIESATCRLPGTACLDGYCRKPLPSMACDGAPCADGSVCCGRPAGCQPKSDCRSFDRVRCTRHADCIAGQKCAASGWGTDCVAIIQDPESQQLLCKTDGECGKPCRSSPGKRARCLPSEMPWLKSCQCPD